MKKNRFYIVILLIVLSSLIGLLGCGTSSFVDTPEEKDSGLIIKDGVLTGFNNNIPSELVIPNEVTTIAKEAFKGCNKLEKVKIPSTVTSIEDRAFINCVYLKKVEVGSGVTLLGKSILRGCYRINYMKIYFVGQSPDDNNNPHIGYYFGTDYFNDSVAVEEYHEGSEEGTCYYLPKNLQEVKLISKAVPNNAFYNCTPLKKIDLANTTAIGDRAFSGCNRLEDVDIPNTLKTVGDYAFYSCKKLSSIILPQYFKAFGEGAFENCTGLKNVTMYKYVEQISLHAFGSCANLETITFRGTKGEWKKIDKSDDWDEQSFSCVVKCTNGTIDYNREET